MKDGKLFSTYGPEGWKPPLVVHECPARTTWAWCWGAPCEAREGNIVCDCPMMISDNDEAQYISLSRYACDVEDDACKWVHNSSPNGKKDIQKELPQCEPNERAQSNIIPEPFKIDVEGGDCAGPSSVCDAAGWVYCQDAQCGAPVVKHGVLVSECECWQPTNGNASSLPGDNAGASCVLKAQNPHRD